MEVLAATIESHGRVAFTTREVGRMADTGQYISNTALYYAFGLASGRYIDTEDVPTYKDDTEDIAEKIYVTPAAPILTNKQGDSAPGLSTTTTFRNAVSDAYATSMDGGVDANLPQWNRERVLMNGNLFRTFIFPYGEQSAETLAEKLPRYIRLGSGRGKCWVDYHVVDVNRREGSFQLNHPISIYDIPERPSGNVITKQMRPTPLVVEGEFEREHFVISRKQLPASPDDPTPILYPAHPVFLQTKR
jgi:CRISPR-associated protein Csc1